MAATSERDGGLAAGDAALARGAWAEARERFEAVAREAPSAAAWEGVSRAAWWQGDADASLRARERAYRAHREAGNACAAGRCAAWLGLDQFEFRGDDAVGSAWIARAVELVSAHCPCDDRAWVALIDADIALLVRGDVEDALPKARAVLAFARERGSVDLEVVAGAVVGAARVVAGEVQEGVRELEAACALGAAEPCRDVVAPGWALCHTVSMCAQVGEFARARQWTRSLRGFADEWSARNFSGICRTALGSVLTANGEWAAAEDELASAMADFRVSRPGLVAPSAVRLGELRARQGRTDEARALLESARPHPLALVALGRLDLDAGDAASAGDAAERVLRRIPAGARLERIPPLELLALARAQEGRGEEARAAQAALRDAVAALGTPYLVARAALVDAALAARDGRHDAARRAAEDATDLFERCDAVYDSAVARTRLAASLASLGRMERAAAEAAAAAACFEALGAPRDALRAAALASGPAPVVAASELSARELEVLRLVAGGLSDAQIAERLCLSPHTVHRHVANVRAKLRLPSRAAAVAWATRHGLL